jgi:hypothetical protein
MFDWARALDMEHVQSVLRRVPSGQRSGQRRGRYTPLDCNVVLRVYPKTSGGITEFSEHEAD